MLKITYKDYLRYEKLYGKVEKNNKIFELREDEADYSYDKNNEHDKVIRDILMIKEEALSLINKAIKSEKEIKEEIELYNNRFITSKYKERESDIIYKVKNKNVFFLIEHQSTVDYSIGYRMMEYSIEIMRAIIKNKENKRKEYKYPLIIPIIIYTGDKKWDAKLSMKELTEKIEWFGEKEEISLIDVNKYSNEELLQEDNILSKVMLLEKSRNEIEFIKNVEEVLQNTNDKNLEKLKDIIIYKAYDALKEEELEEILEKIKERREEEIMTLGERIRRNEREEKIRIANKARREEKIETIIKMLKLKLDENIIKEVTGVKDTELENVKKELLEA